MMSNHPTAAAFVTAALLASPAAVASGAEINTGYFGSVALEGYDTVAYFEAGTAVKGLPTIAYQWKGATWWFANDEDRALFKANPEAYAPQFAGLCAEGVAFHEISANVEPATGWRIIDGKLYVTAGATFADLEGNLPNARLNWPEVKALLAK
jgi:YHS domain-containing protein